MSELILCILVALALLIPYLYKKGTIDWYETVENADQANSAPDEPLLGWAAVQKLPDEDGLPVEFLWAHGGKLALHVPDSVRSELSRGLSGALVVENGRFATFYPEKSMRLLNIDQLRPTLGFHTGAAQVVDLSRIEDGIVGFEWMQHVRIAAQLPAQVHGILHMWQRGALSVLNQRIMVFVGQRRGFGYATVVCLSEYGCSARFRWYWGDQITIAVSADVLKTLCPGQYGVLAIKNGCLMRFDLQSPPCSLRRLAAPVLVGSVAKGLCMFYATVASLPGEEDEDLVEFGLGGTNCLVPVPASMRRELFLGRRGSVVTLDGRFVCFHRK